MNEVIAIISFIVGLAIGLLQLYIGQRQFESQQRDRMEEIRKNLASIELHIAVMQEATSENAHDLVNKLFGLAKKEEVVDEITEDAKAEIRGLITDELHKVGISEQQAADLQIKVAETIQRSTQSVFEEVSDVSSQLTPRQAKVLELTLQGKSQREIADELRISLIRTRDLLETVRLKSGVTSKEELLAKYGKSANHS